MKQIIVLLLTLVSVTTVTAQITVGSGSLQYTRDQAALLNLSGNSHYRSFNMPAPEAIIVEDFMNYHLHDIKIPKDEDVALSLDYDNELIKDKDEFILQVGIATQPVNLRNEKRNKVNIALVVDVSGSMSGQKIQTAREALARFVKSMKEDDHLSIITFSTEANVLLPAMPVEYETKGKIYDKIKEIEAYGSTNLNAGMMLGYKEVMKYHDKDANSRVILLTDGMVNIGETKHEKIIKNSVEYNKEGIEISTIGVGKSLDFTLLRELADRGRGSNYFIGENEEDMYKVFNEELDGIMYNIGKKPRLNISLPKGFEILCFYGYQPEYKSNNEVYVDFPNLGANSTRIFMMKVKKARNIAEPVFRAGLEYMQNGKSVQIDISRDYDHSKHRTNGELAKNYDITFMAQTLKNAAVACHQGNKNKSERILENTARWMQESSYTNDVDFKRVHDILKQYLPLAEVRKEECCKYLQYR